MADRIAVMEGGHVVQVASPLELYRSPRNTYVAEFINAGTVVRGDSRRSGDVVEVAAGALVLRGQASPSLNGATSVAAVLPPHRVRISASGAGSDGPAEPASGVVAGTIERLTFTGAVYDCHIRVTEDFALRAALTLHDLNDFGGVPELGMTVLARWRPEDVIFVEDVRGGQVDDVEL